MLGRDMTFSAAVVGPMVWGEEADKVVYISDLLLKQFCMYFLTQ